MEWRRFVTYLSNDPRRSLNDDKYGTLVYSKISSIQYYYYPHYYYYSRFKM